VAHKHLARQAGKFVKHVLPAAIKPVHSLWHEILGFVFLVFAAIGSWKVIRNSASLGPLELVILIVFIVVMAAYGVSSFLKAWRISRS
jgi:succinate dehydrogenase hydrophobic anchor subunit